MNISIFLIIQGFSDSEISFKLLLIYFNSSNYKFDDVEDYASLEKKDDNLLVVFLFNLLV